MRPLRNGVRACLEALFGEVGGTVGPQLFGAEGCSG